jgi:DNA-binding MarR family transcriptional regulator
VESIRINAADSRWRDILELDARMQRQKGIGLLTPEARVLLFLMQSGPVSVSSALKVAGTSYRGFYTVLERLKKAGLVASTKDAEDQRVRRLKLDPSMKPASSQP